MRPNTYLSREIEVRRRIARRKRELRLLQSIERAIAKYRRESENAKRIIKSQEGDKQ